MSFADQIKKLTKNEITVLFYKCKKLKYVQIGERLGYSVGWVTLQMGGVYTKLGFSKEMHWTKRNHVLENEICPLLPSTIDNWEPELEIREATPQIRDETREENIEVFSPKDLEDKVDPEMMALVLYDEKMLIETTSRNEDKNKKEDAIIEIRPEKPPISCLPRVLMGVFAVSLLIAVAYSAYFYGRNLAPQATPEVKVVTATFPPTPIESPTPIFTETSLPTFTFTPEPTFTPLPTETAFIPPADGILFQDDFESGDLSAWTQYSGSWFVANGELTMLGDEGDYYEWIGLNRPEWKNYVLSVKIKIPFQGSASQEYPAIAVRNNKGAANILGVIVNSRSDVYWAFIRTNQFDTESIAGENFETNFESGSTVEIEVQGDTYILRVNGREVQRITIGGFNSGGISLGIMCYDDCPTFDNVKVIYLP